MLVRPVESVDFDAKAGFLICFLELWENSFFLSVSFFVHLAAATVLDLSFWFCDADYLFAMLIRNLSFIYLLHVFLFQFMDTNLLALGFKIMNAPFKPLPNTYSREFRQLVDELLKKDPS